jgi:hypothetical protein
LKGFVRFKGECIPKDECPKPKPPKCRKNEVFDECVKSLKCQASCKKQESSFKCKKSKCKPGCKCKKGYVRNNDNECIKKSSCKKCPRNEEFKCICAEPSCKNTFTSMMKCKRCISKCYCKDGFFRNKNHQCVGRKNCRFDLNSSSSSESKSSGSSSSSDESSSESNSSEKHN